MRPSVPALLLALTASLSAAATAEPAAPQAMDAIFAQHVRQWTTRPELVSPLVDHLPVSTQVPSPREVLGHDVGAPRVLDYYEDLLRYYQALADHSHRVKIIETGRTEEGRPTVVVLFSSEANLARLDEEKADLVRLADPRGTTPAQAQVIMTRSRPLYLILGGLHSAETGPPEMLLELAYRLAAEESPLLEKIRDQVIVGINPASDPDGRDRYTDWYHRNKIDDTDDLDPVPGAPYWGRYIFHDNNRDINYSGLSARSLLGFYLQWHPQVVHDLHESVPFLYIYSGQPPQNPDLDPLLYSLLPWFSNFEIASLTRMGMPGVWDHGYVDAWSPGYVAFMSSNHNGVVRFYETFGNGGATTELRHVKPVKGAGGGEDRTQREWYRPLPPYKTVEWSLRNNTNFMETGILTALETAATFPRMLMESFYQMGSHSIEDGRTQPPYAYLIPGNQPDMTRVAQVLALLEQQGIEIGRATAAVKLKDGEFPAGSFLIKRNQPYGRLARILLDKQEYPAGTGEPLHTYDDSAWTMGLMSHIKVQGSTDKAALDIATLPVHGWQAPGSIGAAGAASYAVLDFGSNNLATLRHRLKEVPVEIAERSFQAGGQTVPAGSFLVPGAAYGRLKEAVMSLGLTAVALTARPDVPRHPAALPRVALYSTWGNTQNVGWVRFAFDQYETEYSLLFKDDVRKGHLRERYDLIIIPSQGRSAKDLVFDIPMHGRPLPYTKTARFKYLGDYGSSEDIRGGMGLAGLEELRRFVESGGTLITLGEASAVPAEFGLVPDIGIDHPSKAFYAPGPIVTAKVLVPTNPIFYGYSDETMPVRWASNALLSVPLRERQDVLMELPGGTGGVLSGEMAAAAEIRHRPAVVDLPVGDGQVLMFATNPVYRWQKLGEFRMLYNAIFNYKSLRLGVSPVRPEPPPDDSAD